MNRKVLKAMLTDKMVLRPHRKEDGQLVDTNTNVFVNRGKPILVFFKSEAPLAPLMVETVLLHDIWVEFLLYYPTVRPAGTPEPDPTKAPPKTLSFEFEVVLGLGEIR